MREKVKLLNSVYFSSSQEGIVWASEHAFVIAKGKGMEMEVLMKYINVSIIQQFGLMDFLNGVPLDP